MKNVCLNWTISILTGLLVLFLFTTIGYIFHVEINYFYLPISILVSLFLIAVFSLQDFEKNKIRAIFAQYIVLFDIFILFGFLSYCIADFSWDGTTYHQATIILLKWGLNPIWDNIIQFAQNQEYFFEKSMIYVETFLKFYEIIGANIYYTFDKIELTKVTNFIFMVCACCYTFYTLKNFSLKLRNNLILTFLIIYNPVCICQMLTNYVDGDFYYVFLILLFALINFVKGIDEKKSLYLICISTIIFSNLKLTGLFLSILMIAVFVCAYRSKKLLIMSLISIMMILITGIHPYFTNIRNGHNPFYPVINGSIINANREYMITSYPEGFENKNRFEKFFFSVFAVSKNSSRIFGPRDKISLKIPFTIQNDDKFIYEDMRLAGFGWFFSGILTISTIMAFFLRFNNREDKKIFWLIMSILIFSTFANHEAWWARFVPYLWFLPLWIILFIFMDKHESVRKMIIVYLLLFICFINSVLINVQNFTHNLMLTEEDKNYIKTLPKILYQENDYLIENPKAQTLPVKLKEYGIKVIIY